jgi:hypothetical protein
VKHNKCRIENRPEALLPTASAVSKTWSEIDERRFLLGICIYSDFILHSILDILRALKPGCGQAPELHV